MEINRKYCKKIKQTLKLIDKLKNAHRVKIYPCRVINIYEYFIIF